MKKYQPFDEIRTLLEKQYENIIGAILYKQLPILHLQLNYSLFAALKRKPHAHIAHSI